MLLSVSADVKQAKIVYVNEVPEVVVQDEGHRQKRRLTFRSAAETKSERCVKSAPVNPEKNISGQRNYNRSRRSFWRVHFLAHASISPIRLVKLRGTVNFQRPERQYYIS